jgi:hypothetical protein
MANYTKNGIGIELDLTDDLDISSADSHVDRSQYPLDLDDDSISLTASEDAIRAMFEDLRVFRGITIDQPVRGDLFHAIMALVDDRENELREGVKEAFDEQIDSLSVAAAMLVEELANELAGQARARIETAARQESESADPAVADLQRELQAAKSMIRLQASKGQDTAEQLQAARELNSELQDKLDRLQGGFERLNSYRERENVRLQARVAELEAQVASGTPEPRTRKAAPSASRSEAAKRAAQTRRANRARRQAEQTQVSP